MPGLDSVTILAAVTPNLVPASASPLTAARIDSTHLSEPWEAVRQEWTPQSGDPACVWESPCGESIAALGAAARFERSGPDRFVGAREWIDTVVASAKLASANSRKSLIALGAFAFAADPDGSRGRKAGGGDSRTALWVPGRVWRSESGARIVAWSWTPDEEPREVDNWPRSVRAAPESAESLPLAEWTRSAWTRAVRAALARIESGCIEKVVLARCREIVATRAWEPIPVYAALREAHPSCCRYFYADGSGSVFLGASPERLVSLRAGRVEADAVAGTLRGATAGADENALAETLAADRKERREHGIVVREIAASLKAICDSVAAESGPSVQRLPHLLHLRTRITAAARPGTHILDLVSSLHPTSAVAGYPRAAALDFLREWEPVDRGWYAGPVGWMNAAGEGDFTVGLRSVLLRGDRALLFAGAGIVAGSDPDREWEECEVKMRTIEDALNRG